MDKNMSNDFNKETKNKEEKHLENGDGKGIKEEDANISIDDREYLNSVETFLSFFESDAPTNEPGTPSQSFKHEAKFTLKNARTLDMQKFTEDKLTSHDQIPKYILQMLMMANYHVREFTLEGINPMDALLGIFHCSDNFLRQYIAVKLSECQLSVPFILPDPDDPVEKQTILLSTLGKITKSWRGASINDSAKEVYATEHPFPIVSFIRVGNVTMSKSSLMNKIISDGNGDHEFFFHKNMEGGDFVRRVVDGLVEIVWYLPGGCDKNMLKNEICFANLRGNAQNFKKQVKILREISHILCVLLPSEMPDKPVENFLEKAMSSKSKIILIFKENMQEEVKNYYDSVIDQHSTKLYSFTKSSMTSDYRFLKSIRQAIQSNIKEKEVKSLETFLSKKSGVYVDDDQANVEWNKTFKTWLSFGIENTKTWFKLQLHIPVLADLERKKHNPKFRPNNENTSRENVVIEPYDEDITKEKKAQMESFQKMNTEIRHFLNSIAVMDERMLNRNLQRLKYLFDKASLSAMAKLQQQYRLKVQETHNDMLDSQSQEENRLKDLEALISYSLFGLEHVIRELAQLHQLSDLVINNYASVGAKILLSGHPLELLDGDSGYLPLKWFDAVYKEVERETNNARICVISVLGIQNSGKSAMLNAMFGLEFPVSRRKCTRGSFVCLVPLSDRLKSDSNLDFLMIIDTEGLDPTVREHSIELATFVIGVADVTIVNIFGENYNEMKEFLAMAVHAFLKMKLVKDKKSCKIVHQNVSANDVANKLMMDRRNLKQNLDHMVRLAAIQENCEDQYKKLGDIITFHENKDVFYIPSLLKGSPPMAPINPNYGRDLQKVKENIIQLMCSKEVVKLTVSSFRERVKGVWQAMLKENVIFSFRNVIEIRVYASLGKKIFKESVEIMVNGMAEIERSIERDLKRCTTREKRKRCWMSSKKRIFAKAEQLKTKMEKEMQTFFQSSEDKSTLEQWKKGVMDKIKRYKRNQEASVIENSEATFHHLQQQQDVEERKKVYEKQLLSRAKNLVSTQKTNDEEECKATFQREWKQWIGEVPPFEEVKRDINEYMVFVLLPENSDLRADLLTKLKPKEYRISAFFNADPVIDRDMLSFNGGSGLKVVQNVYNWFIQDDVSRANNIKNKVISKGEQFAERVSNKAVRFTHNDLKAMYDEIISTIDKETEKQNMKFKKPLVCDILLYTFARAFPIFDKMEERYVEERDIRQNLEKTLRPRLEKYFINLCKEMEKEVLAATSLVDVLREPIKSELNKGIVAAVDTKLSTKSMFVSKAHFHASVLIQLGENLSFELFVPYLKNPIQFLKNKLKEYVEDFCLNTGSKLVQSLLKDEGEKLKSDIFSAIEDANEQAKDEIEQGSESWKVTNWIKKFVEQCSSLAITKEMFGVATMNEDLKETDLFDKKVREFVENFVQELTDAELDSETIGNWQPAPHERLFKSLFGGQAVCPFCKALYDKTMEQSNLSDNGENLSHYGTKMHRPLCLAGYRSIDNEILIYDICTFLVAGNEAFQNMDTNWKPHSYESYQLVNENYASWKIPLDPSFEQSKYWQWFMVNFSKELANYYNMKEPEIPSSWKNLTLKEAIEHLKEILNF
ncbi:interferon-induced very large GTPase 1-like [Xenia sp. Carnegie-2017]|uniref:interferon-induced very large GTPase 1-like n=1 Tax=Xenia sp. Carnegie-2017 TaxID=2897299 RepID=UPI001F03A6E4|nr:interferon-induced very large GTPase 1-like [Xenia sp. Carnegie-2017]